MGAFETHLLAGGSRRMITLRRNHIALRFARFEGRCSMDEHPAPPPLSFPVEVQEAATSLANLIARSKHPLDPLFHDTEACAVLIDRRPDLLDLLKVFDCCRNGSELPLSFL